ncbi:hypothetical protein SAMN05519104_6813 [Rhizobiales bacterium GAS188]|nr:hypothetical protein SAMN05519104_6813 [Rhizobiales bacterium GAS188]
MAERRFRAPALQGKRSASRCTAPFQKESRSTGLSRQVAGFGPAWPSPGCPSWGSFVRLWMAIGFCHGSGIHGGSRLYGGVFAAEGPSNNGFALPVLACIALADVYGPQGFASGYDNASSALGCVQRVLGQPRDHARAKSASSRQLLGWCIWHCGGGWCAGGFDRWTRFRWGGASSGCHIQHCVRYARLCRSFCRPIFTRCVDHRRDCPRSGRPIGPCF